MACRRWFDLRRCVGLDLSGEALKAVAAGLGERERAGRARRRRATALRLPLLRRGAVRRIGRPLPRPVVVLRRGGACAAARRVVPLRRVPRRGHPRRGRTGPWTACGLDLAFHADVGPRVRRHWAAVSAALEDTGAVREMDEPERATVGPGADSALGRLLSDGHNGYHLMRWRRSGRVAEPRSPARRRPRPGQPGRRPRRRDHRGLRPGQLAPSRPRRSLTTPAHRSGR